jgi:formylglycine-generating enzyme required for sulfatase activity/type 1 glutamine amidotransferase
MMLRLMILPLCVVATIAFTAETTQNPWDPNYVVTEATAKAIEAAMPDEPVVTPARPRKLLIYGRKPTHPMSVACCFKAIETLGKKTGAFKAVASGDPLVFLPDNLKQFDAVLMNNTHEQHPMLPINFDKLRDEQKAAARDRELTLQKSLFDFVAGGKGIVGIHGAVATSWKEYLDMMGGSYGGHFTTNVWVKPDEPSHPVCAPLNGQSFQLFDEIYVSKAANLRKTVRVLLSLDMNRTPDPRKRDDGDYAISWVRSYGKGRVFYCSLGHEASCYHNPHVLRHYLAGIQFALGDLKADATPRWPAARPVLGACASAAAQDESLDKKGGEKPGERILTNSIGMKLTLIPAGEFLMGGGESAEEVAAFFNKTYGTHMQALWWDDEHPQHRVRITRPFYLGTRHVTRGQFRRFVEATGYKTDAEKAEKKGASGFNAETSKIEFNEGYSWRNVGFPQTDEHPVVCVSWNDALAFCEWLSRKEGQTYRLPSEAEWEYACRAGTTTRYSSGDDPETLARVGNVADAAAKARFPGIWSTINASDGYVFTAPVGQFRVNAFGLYDMHGNVWQWCADWHDERYRAASPADDPAGPAFGKYRVRRGGSWNYGPAVARSANRSKLAPGDRDNITGFRVVRTYAVASAADPQAREDEKTVALENDRIRIVFDKTRKGNLAAIVDRQSGRNFIATTAAARLYTIIFADKDGKARELSNNAASEVRWQLRRAPGETGLVGTFSDLGGQRLSATVTVSLRADWPLSAWRIEVENDANLLLRSVTFPKIHAPLTIGAGGEGDAVALPVCDGYLIERPGAVLKEKVSYLGPHLEPYPGRMSAQLMAYYGKPAGLYMATYDAAGHPKRFGVTRCDNDLLFSYTHHFPQQWGKGWTMPYDFVLGTFQGDWHDAADIYKQWAVKQFWCAKTLAQREDVPAWVKEAPVFHTLSVRAPDKDNKPRNSWPLLPAYVRAYCETLKSKECVVLTAWEKHGAWFTPDYFPPFGGADVFRKTASEILKDGNQTFVFLSGFKWTLKNELADKDYDGWPSFEKEGARGAVIGASGKPLIVGKPDVDITAGCGQFAWLCQGAAYTKELMAKIALQCVDLGVTCVQVDQIVGMGMPPCYSTQHGHPVGYGVWQYEHLRDLLARVRRECRQKNPKFALSFEEPAELAIPLLDVYLARDYMQVGFPRRPDVRGVPLFTYLYHEYLLGNGADMAGVTPGAYDAHVMQHAMNLVCGKTPGVAVWRRLVEAAEVHPAQLRMLKAHTNLLGTSARDYLLMGRMLHPLVLDVPRMTIPILDWRVKQSFPFESPSVLHSGWALPNGNRAYVFANISHADVAISCQVPALTAAKELASLRAYSTASGQLPQQTGAEPLPKHLSFTLKPQEVRFVEIILTQGANR